MPEMTEYELHTQGGVIAMSPMYDGRDPMRNRPHSNGTYIPMNHDAISVQICLSAGLSAQQTDALLTRLSGAPKAPTPPATEQAQQDYKALYHAEQKLRLEAEACADMLRGSQQDAEKVGADKDGRNRVAKALGLGSCGHKFAWSYLIGCIEDAVKIAEQPDPAKVDACVAPVSDKPACGAQNSKCERQADKVDALCDSNYLAGAKEGWNLAAAGDSEGFKRLFESRRGYLKPIRDAQTDPAMAGDEIIKQLQGMAGDAYSRYIRQLRDDHCKGAEYKLDNNKFGVAELAAHNKAYEFLGRHRAFSEAADLLKRVQPANGEVAKCKHDWVAEGDGAGNQIGPTACCKCGVVMQQERQP